MYKTLVRPLLFLIDPERVHHLTFTVLRIFLVLPGMKWLLRSLFEFNPPALEKKILGLTFRNPVGLAAGFDKDAKLIDALECFGFGFIEIGTLTPRPQPGNERPRLFRLPSDAALINRMGFNNEGVEAAVSRLKNRNKNFIVGGNLGKNKETPNELAMEDYLFCFESLYPCVDYFVVNVSSPNTPGLRDLQEKKPLHELLAIIKQASAAKEIAKPVLLKISPDLTVGQLDDVIDIIRQTGTDGIIATNTTIKREGLTTPLEEIEKFGNGGLSGKPLAKTSTDVIRYLRTQLGPDFPIIGVGGIMNPADAIEKLDAGADLVQIYTGFVYEGPGFVKRINRVLARAQKHTTS